MLRCWRGVWCNSAAALDAHRRDVHAPGSNSMSQFCRQGLPIHVDDVPSTAAAVCLPTYLTLSDGAC
jgi:hypothetical protein